MKKLLSLVLSTLLLCTFATTSAFADNNESAKEEPYIEARYSDFAMVFATLYRTDSGFYHMEGGAGCYDGEKWLELTMTLEVCGSDGKYHAVDGYTWTDSDYFSVAAQATRDLPGGGYRVHTVAKCYLNGKLLETVEAYSNTVNVPY